MNGVKQFSRIETPDNGHIMIHRDDDKNVYLTVAGTSVMGKPLVSFVRLDKETLEQLSKVIEEVRK